MKKLNDIRKKRKQFSNLEQFVIECLNNPDAVSKYTGYDRLVCAVNRNNLEHTLLAIGDIISDAVGLDNTDK